MTVMTHQKTARVYTHLHVYM